MLLYFSFAIVVHGLRIFLSHLALQGYHIDYKCTWWFIGCWWLPLLPKTEVKEEFAKLSAAKPIRVGVHRVVSGWGVILPLFSLPLVLLQLLLLSESDFLSLPSAQLLVCLKMWLSYLLKVFPRWRIIDGGKSHIATASEWQLPAEMSLKERL